MGCGWEAETAELAELEFRPGTPCDPLSSGRPLELLRAMGDARPWAHLGSSLERRGAVKTFLETCDSDSVILRPAVGLSPVCGAAFLGRLTPFNILDEEERVCLASLGILGTQRPGPAGQRLLSHSSHTLEESPPD